MARSRYYEFIIIHSNETIQYRDALFRWGLTPNIDFETSICGRIPYEFCFSIFLSVWSIFSRASVYFRILRKPYVRRVENAVNNLRKVKSLFVLRAYQLCIFSSHNARNIGIARSVIVSRIYCSSKPIIGDLQCNHLLFTYPCFEERTQRIAAVPYFIRFEVTRNFKWGEPKADAFT